MASSPTYVLHEDPISAHTYKIKLIASLLKIPMQRIQYSIHKGETRTSFFLENISAFGRIPVLQIGGDVKTAKFLPESNAACYYLADTAASSESGLQLIPSDAFERAEMLRWMFFEQNHIEPSIAVMRSWRKYVGIDTDAKKSQVEGKMNAGYQALDCMESHLTGKGNGTPEAREWFVGGHLTLADVALFAYIHVAHEGGYDLEAYPMVKAWIARIEALDGFIKM